jgi:cytochrome c biogenesis protein CcdA
MEGLLELTGSKEFPILTSLFLGLLVSISPCTVAANVSAVGFLTEKNKNNNRKIFINGLIYTLGRSIAYIAVGILIFYFAQGFNFGEVLQLYIGKIIGPVFIIAGILMLDIIHIHGLADKCLNIIKMKNTDKRNWSPLLIGIILAFAFCPYCAAIYFGMLVPLSVSVPYGVTLYILFAAGAAIPVLIITWVIAFSYKKLSDMYDKLRKFEFWFRKILGILFIISGIMFILEYYFDHGHHLHFH